MFIQIPINNDIYDAGKVYADGTAVELAYPESKEMTLSDAQSVLKCALKIIPAASGDVEVLDQDGDSAVTLDDAVQVLKCALKIQ